jgi:hypothetical protein
MDPPSPDPHQVLLEAIKAQLTRIDELCDAFNRAEEDGVYRYYHQSFRVYGLQSLIRRAMSLFDEVSPAGTELNPRLQAIAAARPILEGFWHCR